MKKMSKSMLGVTLLEIMLVLAIAAMIIVMSIRYYQSANSSQQANSFIEQLQAVAAAAENFVQAKGTYSGVESSVSALLPSSGFNQPWGGKFSVSGTTSGFTITPSGNVPNAVCRLVESKLSVSDNWSVSGSCTSIVYDATKSTNSN